MGTFTLRYASPFAWKLRLSAFFATLCCLVVSSNVFGQDNPNLPTSCPKENLVCTANDVRIGSAFIAGSTPTTPINCTAGTTTQGYIYLRVSSDAGRNGVYFIANLVINGQIDPTPISYCFNVELLSEKDAAFNILKIPTPVTFTCGDVLKLTNVYISYSQSGAHCSQSNPACPGAPSKCRDQVQSGDPDIVVETPLVIGLTKEEGDCTGDAREVTFIATASGGAAPYTYKIDYENDGTFDATTTTSNTSTTFTHSYTSGQTYTATLSVLASGLGQTKTTSLQNFTVTACCSFSAACKTDNTVVEVEGCSTAALPTAKTNPSEIFQNITTNPCGTLVMKAVDNATGTLCPDGISVARTYTLFDDLNNNQILDENEQSVTCTRSFKIVDKTAPTLTGTLPGGDQGNVCKANAPTAPSATSIAALYSDNCGTVTATLKSTTPSGDNCSWKVIYKYTISDGCAANNFDVDVTYTGGDKTAPTGTAPAAITNLSGCKPTQDAAAGSFDANYAKGGYSDNCGGTVTAVLTNTAVTGTNCDWTVTYTFKVKDACGNALYNQTYSKSGKDKTAPTFDIVNCTPILSTWNPTPEQIIAAFGTVANLSDNCGTPVAVSGYPKVDPVIVNGCSRSQKKTWKYTDGCNTTEKSCTVTWSTSPSAGCWTVDMIGRTVNNPGTSNVSTTFTFKVCAGNCPNALSNVAFITASNIPVLSPLNGSTYVGTRNSYRVSVPVAKNVYGIKYDVIGEGIKRSACDVYTFTLKGNQTNLSFTVKLKAGTTTTTVPVSANCLNQSSMTTMRTYTTVQSTRLEGSESTKLAVSAYPNPFTDKIRFTIQAPKAGRAVLEVYNMLGQKVGVPFQGQLNAGETRSVEYTAPVNNRANLIYMLRMNGEQVTGKLMNIKE